MPPIIRFLAMAILASAPPHGGLFHWRSSSLAFAKCSTSSSQSGKCSSWKQQQVEQSLPRREFLAAGAAFSIQWRTMGTVAAAEEEKELGFETYFGTAASASSYGGYGGNSSKKDAAEYIFSVPTGWKERLISKVEKGTNGTDAEFYNPKRKSERTYLTFLSGFRKLAARDTVLGDLSLSDVTLQDAISQASDIRASDRTDASGQLYYEYEIDGPESHNLIFVTCARNKLYAHYVKAPAVDWKRDEAMLRHIHDSFMTVGV